MKRMKKRNKAFTLIELIVVIAIIAIIMLIGTVAYAGIRERMQVRADKSTAGQIGKSLVVREIDVRKEDGVPLYPEITRYDELDKVENYVARDIKPQSMKDGNFYVTAFQTQNGKKIVVGIGREGDEFLDKIYKNKKEAGWAWSEDVEISEFIEENRDKITGEETGNEGSSGGSSDGNGGSTGGDSSEDNGDETLTQTHTLTVGINNVVTANLDKEEGKEINVNLNGDYTEVQITGINKTGSNLTFNMPANDVKIVGITE